jgi:SAM-dependent methyltransferase
MNPERPIQRRANPAVRRPYDSPSTWFEAVYTEAENDRNKVPWAEQTQPLLLSWLEQQKELANGNRHTLVVGCGLGDDAETLAQHHLSVTAFDISPRAIAWCRQRFPASTVAYQVADLFHLSGGFRQAFDLVYDALTIQALPPDLHAGAITAIADCVAPGGILLCSFALAASRKSQRMALLGLLRAPNLISFSNTASRKSVSRNI